MREITWGKRIDCPIQHMQLSRLVVSSRLVCYAIFFIVCGTASSRADDRTEREAIRRGTAPVWADREQQEVTYSGAPLSHTDVSDRHDSILVPKSKSTFWDDWFNSRGSGSGSTFFSDFFSGLFKFWKALVLLALVGALIGLLVFILRNAENIRGWWRPNQSSLTRQENIENQMAKLSDLPFELEQPIGGLFAQAERFRAAGDYSRAIIYLFSYCLVEMDQAHCIRLERGKTNRVYLRELRSSETLHRFTGELVSVFEFVFFGKHSVSRETCDAIWIQLPQFERHVASARQAEPSESLLVGATS